MSSIKFQCLQCGECCQKLISTSKVHKQLGLSLLPEEISIFPMELVFPCLSIGRRGQAKTIILFQLGVMRCPFLTGNGCRIYDNRPLACQTFPIQIKGDNPLAITLDSGCQWYKKHAKNNKLIIDIRDFAKEVKAGLTLHKYSDQFSEGGLWAFDLKNKIWWTSTPEKAS